MQLPKANEFIFSPAFRVYRHVLYWTCYLSVWAGYWTLVHSTFIENLYRMLLFLPFFLALSYPLAYLVVPRILLRAKYILFIAVILGWGLAAWYLNALYRVTIFIPGQEWVGIAAANKTIYEPASFLCLTTTAACMTISKLVKHWVKQQQAWLRAEQEKVSAQLQLLMAQLHPHFLFNTLNNIYAFALQNSPKTPEMILRLSSLLSYMLYDCRGEEVLLEKEVEVMKNYMDLEKERYGDKIDVSVNIVGNLCDKYISPLLILPFLENAFKHGTSEQLGRPWMSLDISLKDNLLKCKVVNSKNEYVPHHQNGVGIDNVKKRLEFLYHDKYDLKLADEGDFFVVSLTLELNPTSTEVIRPVLSTEQFKIHTHENALSFNR